MTQKIDTILFDLDGTLLQFSLAAFIEAYFGRLSKVFLKLGMDAGASVNAVWAGTKAMMLNDGSRTNAERFWSTFSEHMRLTGSQRETVEAACDDFYTNDFDAVKSVLTPCEVSGRLVRSLNANGYSVVLATNPLFPACAVTTRLKWIGLVPEDFLFITHYSNSAYCKPNPGYYREIFSQIDRRPEQCLMAGNNPVEDMSVGELGAETFLVTDYLENESGADISTYRCGTIAELEMYLKYHARGRTGTATHTDTGY